MKNFIQSGDIVPVTAPAGGVASGAGVLVNTLFGVACDAAAAGAEAQIATRGVFDLPKTGSGTLAVGAKVYWDNTAKAATSTASGNSLIGVALAAAAADAATIRVRLNGISI